MTPTRRSALLGTASAAAALAAAPLAASSAQAAAAKPAAQAAGVYNYNVGDFVVTAATDGMFTLDLNDSFVTNVEFDEVQSALADAFLPTDKLNIPFTPIIVHTANDTVLFDTGFGDGGPPTARQLRAGMAAVGIKPEDVTKVVISHYHPDHITGVKDKDGNFIYSNAEILAPAPEHAFWTDEARMNAAPEGARGNFQNAMRIFGDAGDRLTLFEWDQEIVPGVTSVAAPGHTPGHTVFVIASGDDSMMFLADTTNHPALFVSNPDWSARFDMDAEMARDTRRKLLDMVTADKTLVSGYHFPFPAAGYIAKDGDGFELVPVQWMPVLQ